MSLSFSVAELAPALRRVCVFPARPCVFLCKCIWVWRCRLPHTHTLRLNTWFVVSADVRFVCLIYLHDCVRLGHRKSLSVKVAMCLPRCKRAGESPAAESGSLQRRDFKVGGERERHIENGEEKKRVQQNKRVGLHYQSVFWFHHLFFLSKRHSPSSFTR